MRKVTATWPETGGDCDHEFWANWMINKKQCMKCGDLRGIDEQTPEPADKIQWTTVNDG